MSYNTAYIKDSQHLDLMLNFNGLLHTHIRFMAHKFAGEFQRNLVKYTHMIYSKLFCPIKYSNKILKHASFMLLPTLHGDILALPDSQQHYLHELNHQNDGSK